LSPAHIVGRQNVGRLYNVGGRQWRVVCSGLLVSCALLFVFRVVRPVSQSQETVAVFRPYGLRFRCW